MKWGTGAAVLLVLLRSSSSGAQDALGRMLVVEANSASAAERAAIVNVALNRAERWDVPVSAVVAPGARVGRVGRVAPTWNHSSTYRKRYWAAKRHRRFAAMRAFARDVLAGKYGRHTYMRFVHPRSLSSPPCAGGRVAIPTKKEGPRCMPPAMRGGRRIGEAVFS